MGVRLLDGGGNRRFRSDVYAWHHQEPGNAGLYARSGWAAAFFDGTHVGIEDAAGNPADSGSFAERVGSELFEESLGICVDTESPQVSVAYDNNDVSNGKYYKAFRTATITVVESNSILSGNMTSAVPSPRLSATATARRLPQTSSRTLRVMG